MCVSGDDAMGRYSITRVAVTKNTQYFLRRWNVSVMQSLTLGSIHTTVGVYGMTE